MARYFEEKSLIKFIDKHTKDDMTLDNDISCILEDMKTADVISREDVNHRSKEYEEWLENMVILLSKTYQETHDMLLGKARNGETKAYFEMPTVQGYSLVMSVDKISHKAKCKGSFSEEQLDGWCNYLIDKYTERGVNDGEIDICR
ncbi:hypothetical protein ACTQ6A_13875 [Lachnospiraceae bacterium LCP25S3_G4]